uniref:RNA-directed DNA polymerase n=1 Tax=Sipha flava TaxID=143950 RepID=A0A2S2R931_9HEMI
MVFGLINAPYEFSRLMQRILHPLKNKVAMWYLDDILVPSTSFDDMIKRLRQVLDALKSANLTLKFIKCYFGFPEMAYLGFMLSADGVRSGEQKMVVVQHFPRPQNKQEVQRFLGLCGFFRRFITHYAQLVLPINELLKEKVAFTWTTSQETSFQTLKKKLVSKPILQLYNSTAHTKLYCDASSVGISGMLLQRGDNGHLHLVHAVSKKTTSAEGNYHSSRLELMVIVWSMTRLRQHLIGIKFIVMTDHQAIVHTQKTVQPQIVRWAF